MSPKEANPESSEHNFPAHFCFMITATCVSSHLPSVHFLIVALLLAFLKINMLTYFLETQQYLFTKYERANLSRWIKM